MAEIMDTENGKSSENRNPHVNRPADQNNVQNRVPGIEVVLEILQVYGPEQQCAPDGDGNNDALEPKLLSAVVYQYPKQNEHEHRMLLQFAARVTGPALLLAADSKLVRAAPILTAMPAYGKNR